MKWIRNIFCLLILLYGGGLFWLNLNTTRETIRHRIEKEIQQSTGYLVSIDEIELGFPRGAVLHGITLKTSEGTFSVAKLTAKISFVKLFIGKISEGSFHIENLTSTDSKWVGLPTNLDISLFWDEAQKKIDGTIDLLESKDPKWRYALIGKGFFTVASKEKSAYQFNLHFDELQFDAFGLEGISGKGSGDFLTNSGQATFFTKAIYAGYLKWRDTTLDLSKAKNSNLIDYAVKSTNPFPSDFSGAVNLTAPLEGVIEQGSSQILGTSIKIVDPVRVIFKDSLMIKEGKLSVGGKEIRLDGKGTLDRIDLQLRLLKQFFSYSLEQHGTISGNLEGMLRLHGSLADLKAQSTWSFDNISWEKFEKPFHGKVHLELVGRALTLQGHLHDHKHKLLTIEGLVPLEKAGIFAYTFSEKEIDFNLSADLPIKSYLKQILPPSMYGKGQLLAEINVKGPYHSPLWKGTAQLREGTFERWESGTFLDQVEADFEILQNKVVLNDLKANDSYKGSLIGSGELELKKGLPFTLDLKLHQCRLVDLEHTEGSFSGKTIFSGDTKSALLHGTLKTNQFDLELTDSPEDLAYDLEVVYVDSSPQKLPPNSIVKKVPWPIYLDLHLITKHLLIHNKELHSEWKGDLNLVGSTSAPLVYGDLKLGKGNYLFLGKKLDIKEGTITFAGDPVKKTGLYVVGEMEIGQFVAQTILKGSMHNPALAFSSNPPMSQREILSWILFGRAVQDISPFQGAELAQSLKHLKNHESSFVDRLKEKIGIDRIDISSGGADFNDELSLQIGKYVHPNLFLGIKRNIISEANHIGIEADLTRNLKFQAELGDDEDHKFHLKWKYDY